jgi:hypothetical protein
MDPRIRRLEEALKSIIANTAPDTAGNFCDLEEDRVHTEGEHYRAHLRCIHTFATAALAQEGTIPVPGIGWLLPKGFAYKEKPTFVAKGLPVGTLPVSPTPKCPHCGSFYTTTLQTGEHLCTQCSKAFP